MKRKIGILAWLVCILLGSALQAQPGQADLESSIHPETLEHPYLLFNDQGRTEILEKIEESREMREVFERQLLEANRYLRMPVNESVPAGGDLSRYFSGDEMRRFMSGHYTAALNLAFIYQLTGEDAYAQKAFRHAEMLCRLESWVYPFHEFPQIYDRVWPWNVNDDQVVFSYDLQTARIATHLALVYDWIYAAMDKGQRDRIRGALLEKAITRVRGNFDYHWWASAYRCNWSGICYSGAGLASLALLTEDPQLTDVVARSYQGVSSMLDELGPDGGWQEGRGYWAYGVGHSLWFMEAVKRLSGGDYNLFRHAKLKDNPADFPLYTLPANFGDGRSGPVGDSWFINKLVAETGNQTAAWYGEEFVRHGETIHDLIWPRPDVKGVEPAVKSKHFRGIDWAVMRSSFHDDASFSIACKAGSNDDPHHGHLDCGHFILRYRGEPVIRDPGSATYDDFYFSAERWDYVEASSKGHNVIYVNGEEQIPAKLKDQPWREESGGSIHDFQTSEGMDYLSMIALEKAYPGKELTSWQRQIILMKPSLAVILDRVGSAPGSEIRSRIHPAGPVTVGEGYVTIQSGEGTVAVVPFSDREVAIGTGRDGSLSVNEQDDFAWIPFVDAMIHSRSAISLVGYIIFPVESGIHPETLVNSLQMEPERDGKLTLSFILEGAPQKVAFPPVPSN